MKRLLYLLGLVELVWTRDFNSHVRLRVVWHDCDGRRYVYGILGPSFGVVPRELLADGECGPGDAIYIEHWFPFAQDPRRVKPLSLSWLKPRTR